MKLVISTSGELMINWCFSWWTNDCYSVHSYSLFPSTGGQINNGYLSHLAWYCWWPWPKISPNQTQPPIGHRTPSGFKNAQAWSIHQLHINPVANWPLICTNSTSYKSFWTVVRAIWYNIYIYILINQLLSICSTVSFTIILPQAENCNYEPLHYLVVCQT